MNPPPPLKLAPPDPGRPDPGRPDPAQLNVPERVRTLARDLGRDPGALPAYIYDLDALARHAGRIRAALPSNVQFSYAVKANPDREVLRTVARHTDGLEVSSGGERRHAAATVPGCAIAFGGPGKTGAELAEAVRAGVSRVHVESPHELHALAAAARAAGRAVDVLLRVNLAAAGWPALPAPDRTDTLLMAGTPTAFGMDVTLLDHCAGLLADGRVDPALVRPRGLHAHLASGLDAAASLGAAGRVLDFGRRWCARHGVTRPEFNLGGGMAVSYQRPNERFDWAGYGRGLAALARPHEVLRIEPGRSVTAYCGWYVTWVLDVKRSHGEMVAVVAGGTHHLRTPAARGHSQPFAVIPVAAWAPGWPRPGAAAEPVTVAGQLCTPRDVLARRVRLGRLRAGDLVAFGLAGAYAWNISHHEFLMHPPPGLHYLAGPDEASADEASADAPARQDQRPPAYRLGVPNSDVAARRNRGERS